jgi:hypothetical protein
MAEGGCAESEPVKRERLQAEAGGLHCQEGSIRPSDKRITALWFGFASQALCVSRSKFDRKASVLFSSSSDIVSASLRALSFFAARSSLVIGRFSLPQNLSASTFCDAGISYLQDAVNCLGSKPGLSKGAPRF